MVTCQPCGTGAITCTSPTNASSCSDGYTLNNNMCISCSNGQTSPAISGISSCTACTISGNSLACTSCASGYVLDDSGTKCISCNSQDTNVNGVSTTGFITLCTTCTIDVDQITLTCTACPSAYVLDSNNPINTPLKCVSCSSIDTNAAGVLVTGVISNCITCTLNTAALICSACLPGYYGTTNCTACPNGSATCSSNQSISTCNTGYALVSSVCIQCPTGCTTCGSSSTITNISAAIC